MEEWHSIGENVLKAALNVSWAFGVAMLCCVCGAVYK
jgi:VIT1/CCC1 family predicted Fe2+/Mn2+ transporter